jgi:MoxR-like ATPase
MLRVRIGYPSAEDEKAVIRAQQTRHPLDDLSAVIHADDVAELQAAVRAVRLDDAVLDYALALVRETRASKHLLVGGSPRASIALTRAAQAHALIHGRDYVLPDDVKSLAVPVLAHRVLGAGYATEDGADDRERIIKDVAESLEVPI